MNQAMNQRPVHKLSAHKLSLVVQYASDVQIMPTRAQLRRWAKSALQRDVRMTLRIVDETEGRELNKRYRGKDYATNVLTFVYDDAATVSGDVVICAPVVEREAGAQHKDRLAHYAHLAIHAALHLQGYDHEIGKDDAERMEAMEREILDALGYPDPYV